MKDRFSILRNEAGEGDQGGGTLLGGAGSGDGGQQQQQQQASQGGNAGAFDFRSLIGDDGNFVTGYHEKLPDSLKEHAQHFAKYRSPVQALEHTRNLQQLLGQKANAVVIPGPDATPEQIATFRERLGVPEGPGGYNLKAPDKLPEGVEWNQERVDSFAKLAHEISLTPQQVAKLQEFDLNGQATQAQGFKSRLMEIEQTELAKQGDKLSKAWGNGPDFTRKKETAERAAILAGYSPEDLSTNPIFRNADFVMALERLGSLMSEDTLAKGSTAGGYHNQQSEAQDIINNPANPHHQKYWNGDEATNAMVRNLMRKK